MNVLPTEIPGVLLFEPKAFCDPRGFFLETYHQKRYEKIGIKLSFVQDNHSFSIRHTLRGLHFQKKHPQGKLIQVLEGQIFDVVVDIRLGSPTFGKCASFEMSGENHHQLYVPPGLAHGFVALSNKVHLQYKCTDYYCPEHDAGVIWNDPRLNIPWPVAEPLLSEKDKRLPRLDEIPKSHLVQFVAG